jgi:uncharacterized repeat protein (TIGR01451 family)
MLSVFGNFEIDGDLVASTNYDWNNLNAPRVNPYNSGVTSFAVPQIDAIQNDQFNTSTDDVFGSGQKESSPPFTIQQGTTPGKADLMRIYVGHNVTSGAGGPNDVYLFLGFNRFSTSGDTFAGFELNQAFPNQNYPAGDGVTLPPRTNGDLLITYNFPGSGAPSIGLLSWSTAITPNNWVNPQTGAVGSPEDLSGSNLGVGAVNTSGSVTNPFNSTSNPFQAKVPFIDGSNTQSFAAGSFGEAAIDLTAALPSAAGNAFHQVYMSTRSSSSYNSNLEDVIKPVPIDIPLKGEIRGTVFNDLNANGTQDPGEGGLSGWTVQVLDTSDTNILYTATTASDGSYDITGVTPGTYHVREVLQNSYQQVSTTFPSGESSTVSVISSPNTSLYGANQFKAVVQAGNPDTGLQFGNRLQGDLSITKTDGKTSAVPGTSDTYTIVVSNSGPSTATGATVADTIPATLTGVTWTATQSGGATGFTAIGSGNSISDTVTMPSGSSITYTVTGTISPTATGSLVNMATVTAPASFTDTNPNNNSATDTDSLTPQVDLSITKTDGVDSVTEGTSTVYTIVVTNSGVSGVTGATVTDTLPSASITSDSWTATQTGGASGFSATGNGNINDTVTMPPGSTITYTLTVNLNGNDSQLVNTVTVTAPSGVTDTTPGNNTATDTDTVLDQAPTVTRDLSTVTVNEGDTAANTGTFSDYDDAVTITASVGTITQDSGTSGNWSWIYTPSTNQTVTITATNADHTISTTTFNVVVNNVAPTITLSTSTITLNEGDGFSRSGSVSDPGTDLPATASVDYGDGTTGTVALTGSTHAFTLNHTYGDESAPSGYHVVVTVTDQGNPALSSSKDFYVIVNNVAPTVTTVPNQAINSGTALVLNPVATFSDPVFSGGPTFTYSIDWGDKSPADSGTVSSVTVGSPGVLTTGLVNGTHTYTISGKRKDTFTVTVTITDDDGAAGSNSFTVTVVKPELVVGGPATVSPGTVALTQQQLKPIVATAIDAWRAAGVGPAGLNLLRHTPVQIMDLNGGLVGGAYSGGILIDPTAAGHGWFVDPTPRNGSEFIGGAHGAAKDRVDLLTVVIHEMGNVLGLPETKGNGIMGEYLPVGVRRLPRQADLASAAAVNLPSVSIRRIAASKSPARLASRGIIPSDLVADVASLIERPALLTSRKKGH